MLKYGQFLNEPKCLLSRISQPASTVKALFSPWGLIYFQTLQRGGLNREGALLERGAYSQNQVTWMAFHLVLRASFLRQN